MRRRFRARVVCVVAHGQDVSHAVLYEAQLTGYLLGRESLGSQGPDSVEQFPGFLGHAG